MFFTLAKVFQKCILVALALVLCLIVMDSFLNKFIFTNSNGEKVSTVASKSQIVIDVAVDTINSNNNANNNDVAVAMSSTDDSQISEAAAILLWWTPFIGEMEYTKNCGNSVCFFTGNHKYITHEKLKVIPTIISHHRIDWIVSFCRHLSSMEVI